MSARISLHTDKDPVIKLASDSVHMNTENIVAVSDYNSLENKPSIEGVELVGDKKLTELGINKDSLGITPETLGITPEAIGMDTADAYSIYSLFHS